MLSSNGILVGVEPDTLGLEVGIGCRRVVAAGKPLVEGITGFFSFLEGLVLDTDVVEGMTAAFDDGRDMAVIRDSAVGRALSPTFGALLLLLTAATWGFWVAGLVKVGVAYNVGFTGRPLPVGMALFPVSVTFEGFPWL